MPVSRKKKIFTISDIPGCGPDEVVFARGRFTVGDQEEINNQLLSMSLHMETSDNPVNMQMNAGAIKRATIAQMVESWTLKEELELPNGETMIAPLPQIGEDPEIVSQLDIEVADFIYSAIQLKSILAASRPMKAEEQESFLTSATEASSAS